MQCLYCSAIRWLWHSEHKAANNILRGSIHPMPPSCKAWINCPRARASTVYLSHAPMAFRARHNPMPSTITLLMTCIYIGHHQRSSSIGRRKDIHMSSFTKEAWDLWLKAPLESSLLPHRMHFARLWRDLN